MDPDKDFEIKIVSVDKVAAIERKEKHKTEIKVQSSKGGETGDLSIYLEAGVLQQIYYHLSFDTSRERGGILLGNFIKSEGGHSVEISDIVAAQDTESSGTRLKFTIDTWRKVDEESERKYPKGEKIIAGWYHSHPGMGVFVSDYDQDVHKAFHSWWQVALVIDPKRKDVAFFVSRSGKLVRCSNWYVYSDDKDVEAVNDILKELSLASDSAISISSGTPTPPRITINEEDLEKPEEINVRGRAIVMLKSWAITILVIGIVYIFAGEKIKNIYHHFFAKDLPTVETPMHDPSEFVRPPGEVRDTTSMRRQPPLGGVVERKGQKAHNLEVWFRKTKTEVVGTDYAKDCFSDDFLKKVGEDCENEQSGTARIISNKRTVVAVYDKGCFIDYCNECRTVLNDKQCFSTDILRLTTKSGDLKNNTRPKLKPAEWSTDQEKPTKTGKVVERNTPMKERQFQQLYRRKQNCLLGWPHKEPKPIPISAQDLRGTTVSVYDLSSKKPLIVSSGTIIGNETFYEWNALYLKRKAGKFSRGAKFSICKSLEVPQDGNYRIEIKPRRKKPIIVTIEKMSGIKQILIDLRDSKHVVRDKPK